MGGSRGPNQEPKDTNINVQRRREPPKEDECEQKSREQMRKHWEDLEGVKYTARL